jgi:prophage regulatory protein
MRTGTARALNARAYQARCLLMVMEGDVRGLPTKSNGVVSVRSLDRRQPSVIDVPQAGSTALSYGQDVSANRVAQIKLLRFPAVRERTGLSRSTIWRLERRGDFPKHHRIAPNVVAWVEQEVLSWIQQRVSAAAIESVSAYR